MKVQFTVTGTTKAQVIAQAARVVAAFAERDEAAAFRLVTDIRVTPLIRDFGTEVPAQWEAEVEAEV